MNVFLGITGASGAPYAARLVSSLAAAGCELGICISSAGYQVLGTELYGDPDLPRENIGARLVEGVEDATIYEEKDYSAPYASGSAKTTRRSSREALSVHPRCALCLCGECFS